MVISEEPLCTMPHTHTHTHTHTQWWIHQQCISNEDCNHSKFPVWRTCFNFIYSNGGVMIFTQPLHSGRIWHKVIFKRSLTGLNSEFSLSKTNCLIKVEEPSLPYYLPVAGGRIIGFIPFPKVLVLCEMQSVSSRIWTHVTVSIFYDDNHYSTGTSRKWYVSYGATTVSMRHLFVCSTFRRLKEKIFIMNTCCISVLDSSVKGTFIIHCRGFLREL